MQNDSESQADDDKYRIHSRLEIIRVLSDICNRRELLSVAAAGTSAMPATIVKVDASRGRLYLDLPPRPPLGAGAQLHLCGRHHGVHIEFSAGPPTVAECRGEPVTALPLPVSMLRLQRREHPRVRTEGAQVTCRLSLPAGQTIAAITDLSIGGLSIIQPVNAAELPWPPGSVVRGCQVQIPGQDPITADLEIRNRFQVRRLGEDTAVHRLGCRLLGLSNRDADRLRRLVRSFQQGEAGQ